MERATFRYYIASVENKDEKQAIEIMHRVPLLKNLDQKTLTHVSVAVD